MENKDNELSKIIRDSGYQCMYAFGDEGGLSQKQGAIKSTIRKQ